MANRRSATRREFLTLAGTAAAGGIAASATAPSALGQSIVAARRPVLDDVDVLVVGGGPAGIGAAIGAARNGAKTLLVENHSFFGGVAAWALGMPINQVRPDGKPRSIVHELLVKKLEAYGEPAVRFGKHELWCNVEYLKVAVLDALEEVGCRYLVHVRAADAIVENNRIVAVVVATKQGLKTIQAKAVVDCTGDADVAYYAGAETMIDPESLMPMTLSLALTNIDRAKVKYSDVRDAIHKARAKYPLIPSGFLEINQIAHSGSWYINHAGTADMGRVDATDIHQRTKAEASSRRQAIQMVQAVRESNNPDLQRIKWIGTGPQVSVRETRRVKGIYVLTEDDAMSGRTFDDAIAWRSGFLDPGGQKGAKFVKMQVHDVPYRAIVPEKLEGLLMAGRCISATHVAAAAGKSMGNCMATGHAAGLAAAISAKKGIVPREVNLRELRDALQADGVNFQPNDRDQKNL
ncbi:MAG: FAD-dependent oxidoreductase [Planctomycetota bacterium]|nr:FAD-dependent oxidoreductase [Planctomycetota bacterium]